MYWILNYLPTILILTPYALGEEIMKIDITIVLFWWLILRQVYLLIVNIIYIENHKVSHIVGLLNMIAVIVLEVAELLICHKISYGEFIGDVPTDLYAYSSIIPMSVILFGMLMYYSVKRLYAY